MITPSPPPAWGAMLYPRSSRVEHVFSANARVNRPRPDKRAG